MQINKEFLLEKMRTLKEKGASGYIEFEFNGGGDEGFVEITNIDPALEKIIDVGCYELEDWIYQALPDGWGNGDSSWGRLLLDFDEMTITGVGEEMFPQEFTF